MAGEAAHKRVAFLNKDTLYHYIILHIGAYNNFVVGVLLLFAPELILFKQHQMILHDPVATESE